MIARDKIETLIDNLQSLPEDELSQGLEILDGELDLAMGHIGKELTVRFTNHLEKKGGLMQLARSLGRNESIEFFSLSMFEIYGTRFPHAGVSEDGYIGSISELYT